MFPQKLGQYFKFNYSLLNPDYAIEIVVKVSNACQAWLFAAVSTANKVTLLVKRAARGKARNGVQLRLVIGFHCIVPVERFVLKDVYFCPLITGVISSVGLERCLDRAEVTGSNPV